MARYLLFASICVALLAGCSLLEPEEDDNKNDTDDQPELIDQGSITVFGKPDSTLTFAHWEYWTDTDLRCLWIDPVGDPDGGYMRGFTHQAAVITLPEKVDSLVLYVEACSLPSHWWCNVQTFEELEPFCVVEDTLTPSRFDYKLAPETILEDAGFAQVDDTIISNEYWNTPYQDFPITFPLAEPHDKFLVTVKAVKTSGWIRFRSVSVDP